MYLETINEKEEFERIKNVQTIINEILREGLLNVDITISQGTLSVSLLRIAACCVGTICKDEKNPQLLEEFCQLFKDSAFYVYEKKD